MAGEALGHERQEGDDAGAGGELVVAGGEELLDGLGAEDAVELAVQVGGGGAQGVLLLDGEVFDGWAWVLRQAARVLVGDDEVEGALVGEQEAGERDRERRRRRAGRR